MSSGDWINALPSQWGNESLEGLVEVASIPEVSWLPSSIGWQVLVALGGAWLLVQVLNAAAVYHSNRYRRQASKKLGLLRDNGQIAEMPALLRETALHAFPRTAIAPLTGQHWERWLDNHCPDSGFTAQSKSLLSQAAYHSSVMDDDKVNTLYASIQLWIARH
ncbi:DUF4381 domain-containing protein [Vibrio paucivorans]|uniref:DUF4381 domain-containing protein n=1 Tax=Vibrio paucivorans TaxID=2829489 RepID=A0A9X3HPF5_9VIBR|nr:DUF4381 domain-containing protein [Vibrio paucivorans]MCW8332623.1 DUF4381 domain-containing protein [Vibrio paucivorans]